MSIPKTEARSIRNESRIGNLEKNVTEIRKDIREIRNDVYVIKNNDLPHMMTNDNKFWAKVVGVGGGTAIVIEFIRYLPQIIEALKSLFI